LLQATRNRGKVWRGRKKGHESHHREGGGHPTPGKTPARNLSTERQSGGIHKKGRTKGQEKVNPKTGRSYGDRG